jgi:3-methyl-2-oxobutanoate hydroxymethyltransferase
MSRITTTGIVAKKRAGERIAVLTAYDYPGALLADAAGVDAILVGDSCATTVMGLPDTLGISMDAMVHHTAMVSRAAKQALIIADLPFLSYQISVEEAVRNAGRLITEGGAQAVKLEGGMDKWGAQIRAILDAGIPIMGHLGLTPQSVHQLGGYGVQASDELSANMLQQAAIDLEKAGCFSLVLEKIPAALAGKVSNDLNIPTIGIGAGPDCDGQVMVMHDILGIGIRARHVKVYADAKALMKTAFEEYVNEVRSGAFPGPDRGY